MSWIFARTEDKTNNGANVLAFENFKENGSIIREVIQNSLDAKREECENIIIEIEFSERKTSAFPGKKELLESLNASIKQFSKSDKKSSEKLLDMRESFENKSHYLVSFRDLNTTGLLGGLEDKDSGTNLFQLIYGEGTTNKNTEKSSGGSFGIGKNAPFTRSQIRSILYETYNVDKQKHIVGKSILTSHSIQGERRSSRGYYIDDAQIELYLGDLGMQGNYGTCVHIPFYFLKDNDISTEINLIIQDILLNFMIALDRNKLEVRLIDNVHGSKTILNSESYSEFISNLLQNTSVNDKLKKIRAMDNLLKNKESVEKYDLFLHEDDKENYIELYVAKNSISTGYKKYFNLREQLMLIEDRKINGKNFKYDAMAIYHGKKLNNVLRDAEPPEHNKWTMGDIRKNEDKKYFKLAKDKVETKLIELFSETTSEQIVLKEFDNNIFSENKNYDEVYTIKKVTEKQKPKSKGDSLNVDTADIFGSDRKIKDKSSKNDKVHPNDNGTVETTFVVYTNVTKKIRNKGDGVYKVQLIEYFNPNTTKINVHSKTDKGGEELITNYKVINFDGRNVELQLNDIDLDIVITIEEQDAIKK